jgi:hypothetical protein
MKRIINVSLIIWMIGIGAFLLLCLSATGANASLVQFSTTGGMSAAGSGLQQILIERIGDTDNESMNVSVIVLNATLNSNEYEFGPVEFYWAPGDNSSRVMNVTVTASTEDAERKTITFGLCKVDGGGDLGDPVRYEMVIEFPGVPIETPTHEPSVVATKTAGTAINNASPTLIVSGNTTNTSAIATIKASPSANNSGNMTEAESSSAQNMPIVLFGGLVSLAVIITAVYLLLFKRN